MHSKLGLWRKVSKGQKKENSYHRKKESKKNAIEGRAGSTSNRGTREEGWQRGCKESERNLGGRKALPETYADSGRGC